MDLGAYAQIDELSKIMYVNEISVPRLRGIRLMKEEKPTSKEENEESIKNYALYICETICRTKRIFNKYLYHKGYHSTGVKWHAIHGQKRKMFRYAFKDARKRIMKSVNVFNKYCGRDDILYIHARIGGNNWYYYGGAEIEKQPWFIEKVDDYFDNTYCDIYARIDPEVKNGQSENS